MRSSSGSVPTDRSHRMAERGVSHRHSPRSRSGTATTSVDDVPTRANTTRQLGELSQGRLNELANVQLAPSPTRGSRELSSVCASREGSAARRCSVERAEDDGGEGHGTGTTPTRIVKTPPTKVRQRLARPPTTTPSVSLSPSQSPQQQRRAPVEKSRPDTDADAEHGNENENDDVDAVVREGRRLPRPQHTASEPPAPAVRHHPSRSLGPLSSTFDATFLFPRASVAPPRSQSAESAHSTGAHDTQGRPSTASGPARSTSRRVSDDAKDVRRQRAIAQVSERNRTWKQLALAEQLRRLDATREDVARDEAQLAAVTVSKRRLEEKIRTVEELHVLTDMLTEKRIRTEARTAKRETLAIIWQQMELLCGAHPPPAAAAATVSEAAGYMNDEEGEAATGDDPNTDVFELGSDLDDGRDGNHSHVHEYADDDDDDEVEPDESAESCDGARPASEVVRRTRVATAAGRAASPEVFAFPCNRQSISLVKPLRRTNCHSLDCDDDDDDDATPAMEPLNVLSPTDEPLEAVLPRLSGEAEARTSVSGSRSQGRRTSHQLRDEDSGNDDAEDGDDDIGSGDAVEPDSALLVQPSATHRCKQEYLRLGRDVSASRARSVSMGVPVVSPDPREVLTNFLAELLFEIEEVAQVCIQVPAPCAQTCMATALRRRARQRHLGDAHLAPKRGFFSFFGGATEAHLSAKPLSTFLSAARRVEAAGWMMEEKLQLLARELSTEDEEDALRERLIQLLISQGDDEKEEEIEESAQQKRAPAPGVMMPEPEMREEDISKSLFSDSHEEEAEEEEEEEGEENPAVQTEQSSPAAPPLPRPPLPCANSNNALGEMAVNPSTERKASDSGPLASGLEAMMPSIAYAMPRLATISRDLDREQSKVQRVYKDAVEAEKQRRRDFIRRLKETYRNVEAPALRRLVRSHRWTQQQLTEELIELGVTHLVLEWNVRRPVRYVPTEALSGANARATGLLVDAACDVRLCDGTLSHSAALSALLRRRVTIRIPVSTVIRTSLERRQQQRQQQQQQTGESVADGVVMDGHGSSNRTSTSVLATEDDDEHSRTLRLANATTTTTATITSAAGLKTVSPKHVSQMGWRPSLGAAVRLASPRLSTATGTTASASSRASASGAVPRSSVLRAPSSDRVSTELSRGAADDDDNNNNANSTVTPPRARSSRSCYFKKELIERRVRGASRTPEPGAGSPGTGAGTAGASPLKVTRVTYKSSDIASRHDNNNDLEPRAADEESAGAVTARREHVVVVEEHETEIEPALVTTLVRSRYGAAAMANAPLRSAALCEDEAGEADALRGATPGSDLLRLTHATAVVASPELMEQEYALAQGAVRATVRFCGEEALRRREEADAMADHVREVWQLREELARLEESNFVAEREAEELEAELSHVVAERQQKLYEARTKLNATKSFYDVLKKEHDEWSDILTDLKQMIGPDADGMAASSTVSAPPSLVRRDRRRS